MSCKPSAKLNHAFNSLQDLINDYIQRHRGGDSVTRKHYEQLSEDEAIERAARLQVRNKANNGWKRHPHFHRAWFYKKEHVANLEKAAVILKSNKALLLKAIDKGFDYVHQLVEELLGNIPKLKRLAFYDITELLCYRWKVEPELVYLHAGTRKGAEELFGKKNCSTDFLPRSLVDGRLSSLRISEIEDFLCIYSRELANLRSRRKLPDWSYS